MGNPQDPSAPPSPYAPPPGPPQDWNTPAPPINTPGLAVPTGQSMPYEPAASQPPAQPEALASYQPEQPPPGEQPPPQQQGVAAPVPLGPQTGSQPAAAYPISFGGGAEKEARDRAKRDDAENRGLAKQYGQAVEQQKQAQDAVSEVQQYQASDIAENMAHQQRQLAEIDARGKESAAAHDRVIQQRDQSLQDAINAQKNMTFDPDAYVHSMGVASKIFTSIAIGLSAIGSSGSIGGNGQNLAMGMLRESIQHGVDQQKEAYRRAGVNIDMAGNAYARARQAGMDDKDATIAARLAAINDHKMAAEVISARYEPDRIAANRKVLDANLEQESVKAQAEFAKNSQAAAARAAADVLAARQTNFNMAVGAERLRLEEQNQQWQHDDRNAALAEKALAAQQKQKAAEGTVAGWIGIAPTPDQQNKAAAAATTERILVRNLQEMADFKQDYGNEVANREKLAEIASTAAQVKIQLKDKAHLGVMSASDEKLLDNIARDPTALGSSKAAIAQFKHLIKQVHADAEDEMASYGMHRNKDYKGVQIIDEQPKEGGK